MLKFQNNTTLIAIFEDFILTVYVVIDDLYHQFVPPEMISRRHVLDANLADSEIITISICGELAETGASVNLPTTKACRNCIFTIERTVTCRKSSGQKLLGTVHQTYQQNFGI